MQTPSPPATETRDPSPTTPAAAPPRRFAASPFRTPEEQRRFTEQSLQELHLVTATQAIERMVENRHLVKSRRRWAVSAFVVGALSAVLLAIVTRDTFEAAETNSARLLRWQASLGVLDVAATDRFGNTLLHVACDAGAAASVKELLSMGADVGVENVLHETPLTLCALSAPQLVPALASAVSHTPPLAPTDPFAMRSIHAVPFGWLALLRQHPAAVPRLPWSELAGSFHMLLEHELEHGTAALLQPHWVPSSNSSSSKEWTTLANTLVALGLEAAHSADVPKGEGLHLAAKLTLQRMVATLNALLALPDTVEPLPLTAMPTRDCMGGVRPVLPALLHCADHSEANAALLQVVMEASQAVAPRLGLVCAGGTTQASCLYAAQSSAAVDWLTVHMRCSPHEVVDVGGSHPVWVQMVADISATTSAGRAAAALTVATAVGFEAGEDSVELLRGTWVAPVPLSPAAALSTATVMETVKALLAWMSKFACRQRPLHVIAPSMAEFEAAASPAVWVWSPDVLGDDSVLLSVQTGAMVLGVVADTPVRLVAGTRICDCLAANVEGCSAVVLSKAPLEVDGHQVWTAAKLHTLPWSSLGFIKVCSEHPGVGLVTLTNTAGS